jgi:hypothetical protein
VFNSKNTKLFLSFLIRKVRKLFRKLDENKRFCHINIHTSISPVSDGMTNVSIAHGISEML